MPVLMDRGPSGPLPAPERFLEVGLVNNMPDAALESTERQFLELLHAAAQDIPVRLRLFALPDVPRADAGRRHLDASYSGIADLWSSRLDGLIVTGTEPRAPSLADEPYWAALTAVLDWAQSNTASTVWSCLAAHAAVLHMDGVRRQPLDEKRFGLFECAKASNHSLLAGLPARIRIPHSRCNELEEQALTACDYAILTRSPDAGVDAFIKQGKSLFVFFQGHPEYDDRALLREYRRDIARYLRRERETYPSLPQGYFDAAAVNSLTAFRNAALAHRNEDLLESFPLAFIETRLGATDRTPVVRLYRNWLSYLYAQKAQRQRSPRAQLRLRRSGEAAQGVG
jgi:homoserine O-succinyltransferase/O-acetyltransferase